MVALEAWPFLHDMADERQQIPDFYKVLGVGSDASADELRRAWRVAVKQWHPDTNRSPDAHRMMTRINEAWEVLGNPERRAEYDIAYFRIRVARAEEERKRREEELRKRKAQQERERWERERRRKAELERKRREQQRINREAKERERKEKARQELEGNERKRREREESVWRPGGSRKVPFGVGFASGILLSLIVAAIVILLQQLGDWRNQDDTTLAETAGWGTIRATGDGSVDCSAEAGGVRNDAAFDEFPSAEALILTPDAGNWSAGFLWHSSGNGYSVAAVRQSGGNSRS